MLDPEPVSGPAPAHGGVAAPAAHRPDSDGGDPLGSRLPRPPEMLVQAAQAGARVAGSGINAVRHPRAAFERSRALAELLMRGEIAGAPHTSLNVPIGQTRRYAVVRVPLAEADPQARLVEIAAATKRLKSSGAAGGPTALLDLAALAPPVVVHATLARTAYSTRLFNVTITNVLGQQQPLYAFGSLMREIYPFVPLAAEHAVGIAIFSYNGSVTFGISADSEATPDIDVLAYGIESGLEELRALARDRVMPA
jgi:hypothetical protein